MVTGSRPLQDNAARLAALQASRFEFVVIGGVAAVLHGSTRMTVDLDVLRDLAPIGDYHALERIEVEEAERESQ